MAHYPKANWRGPIPNRRVDGMVFPIMGVVLHIEQGSESSADNWFHNPAAQASAHFGSPKNGPIDQWVDTSDVAWAEVNGNPKWWSIEHEGMSGQPLNANQLQNDAQLIAWLHTLSAFLLKPTDSVSVGGLGWHGMGGAAWGNHTQCPGDPIKNQRGQILTMVQKILAPPPPTNAPPKPPPVAPPAAHQYAKENGMVVIDVQEALLAIAHGISYYTWETKPNNHMLGTRSRTVPRDKVLFAFARNLNQVGIPHAGA